MYCSLTPCRTAANLDGKDLARAEKAQLPSSDLGKAQRARCCPGKVIPTMSDLQENIMTSGIAAGGSIRTGFHCLHLATRPGL